MEIRAENLSKRFNYEWIFRDFSFVFKADHTYAITGPNGSGKSTLLQVLWQQVPPTSGTVTYLNNETIETENIHQWISIATPYLDLIDEFTLREMVDFHVKLKKTESSASTDDILKGMELEHAADKGIQFFSSGMRQRVKLGLAFFTKSSVLFLDEPTTNLDAPSFQWYQTNLRKYSPGKIVLIASNQTDEYPPTAEIIDIRQYKKVTSKASTAFI
jgi:ABC-type multidrug transport system ATPase subunit